MGEVGLAPPPPPFPPPGDIDAGFLGMLQKGGSFYVVGGNGWADECTLAYLTDLMLSMSRISSSVFNQSVSLDLPTSLPTTKLLL